MHSVTFTTTPTRLFTRVEAKQAAQKCNHDGHTNLRVFQVGDPGTLRMDLPGYQGKLRRKEGHFLTLSPYLMAESLKKTC